MFCPISSEAPQLNGNAKCDVSARFEQAPTRVR